MTDRRIVGYRRYPSRFVKIQDCILIDGELCDALTGEPVYSGSVKPVYEGDPGWEKVEELTKKAERGDFDAA